jgi:hypothetical protein
MGVVVGTTDSTAERESRREVRRPVGPGTGSTVAAPTLVGLSGPRLLCFWFWVPLPPSRRSRSPSPASATRTPQAQHHKTCTQACRFVGGCCNKNYSRFCTQTCLSYYPKIKHLKHVLVFLIKHLKSKCMLKRSLNIWKPSRRLGFRCLSKTKKIKEEGRCLLPVAG